MVLKFLYKNQKPNLLSSDKTKANKRNGKQNQVIIPNTNLFDRTDALPAATKKTRERNVT